MIEREDDFRVVGQAGSVAEGRKLLKDADVAVVDLDLPDGSGVELIRDLRKANPTGVVMVLTASGDRMLHARAVEAGAASVMHKSSSIRDIIDAVRRLSQGQPLLTPNEMVELLRLAGQQRDRDRDAQQTLGRLTRREREVLQALAAGQSDKEIADQLGISGETARTHMVNILGKLGVESRLQALIYAVRHGAVTIG